MKEAMFYQQLENNQVRCELCPHFCKLKEGQAGICGVRQNKEGKLYALVHEQAIAVNVDPIEKKPLFHVAPGSYSLSIATVGCNFKCQFCQNCDISQVSMFSDVTQKGSKVTCAQVVALAKKYHCDSISYTYTEPTIFFEYAYETAQLAQQEKLINIFVSNGYINVEPLRAISPYLHAANVDLKSFRAEFYKELVGAKLTPVLDTLKRMKQLGIWLEVTTLVIPTKNDTEQELTDIAQFIKEELGAETPWHVSRFHPQYKLTTIPATPAKTLKTAYDIGRAIGLRYVYIGNIPGDDGESTFCYHCGKLIIKRYGFSIREKHIKNAACEFCGSAIDGLNLG